MKVLLINGSPNKDGCTFTALNHMSKTLNERGVETEIFNIEKTLTGGCLGCGKCGDTGKCIFDDSVNKALELAKDADGFVFGSPVHYASPSGVMMGFMDRFFCAGGAALVYKPAAIAVVARRGGCTAAFDTLAKYPTYNQMPLVSADYWPIIHGHGSPEELLKDEEGLATLETLARNMTWMLKCIEAGKKAGIEPEIVEKTAWTNFIR